MVVHCKRAKYDVYIGRPASGGAWGYGNPFEIGVHGDRTQVIAMFDGWLESGTTYGVAAATEDRRKWILANLEALKGKTLGCWCNYPTQDCHGRIYLERLDKLV